MAVDPERPPVFKTWARVYALVLGNLMLLLVLFYVLTRVLS